MPTINTTAIKKYNVAITEQSGRVGNVRYIQRSGETYVRAASNKNISNPRSDKQMDQRLRWASLAAFYSKLGTNIHTAFQNKASNQSDFNAFMQFNKSLGCYMTKEERQNGTAICMPVQIAQGSLTSIIPTISGTTAKLTMFVKKAADVSTVKALTSSILNNCPSFKQGDQITVLTFIGNSDGTLGSVNYKKVVLDLSDDTKPNIDFSVSTDGYLQLTISSSTIGLALIHTNADKKSSNTSVTLTDAAQTTLDDYLSDEKFTEARDSYGKSQEVYLTPGSSVSDATPTPTGKVTLTLIASPTGKGTFSPVSGTQYTIGTTATVTATPISGYDFDKWSDGNTSATRTVTMNDDTTLTAIFTEHGLV